MNSSDATLIFNEAVLVAFKLSLPILLISMIMGLIISIFQAATQIHEQTLTFIPKIIILGVLLIILGPWMLRVSVDFFNEVVKLMLNLTK
ncbi:MAG: flagellar biosynthesis protein FliQ [Oscillospiraceae bacterium]|nr:flagellar biosynthesis protein FliQ [Oscillospiraceae bacterium]